MNAYLTNAGLKSLTKCLELTSLDLELCGGFTDAGVMHIVKRLPKLECLNVGGCRQVTNVSVQSISEKLKKR